MNKRKGSLYEQKSKVTPKPTNNGREIVQQFIMDDHLPQDDSSYHPHIQQHQRQHQQQKQNQFHHYQQQSQSYHNYQQQNHDYIQNHNPRIKHKKSFDNHYEDNNSNNYESNKSILKEKKQNRAQSAQRASSLDKKRQAEYIFASKNNNDFIENTPLLMISNNHQYNNKNNKNNHNQSHNIEDQDIDMESQQHYNKQRKNEMFKQMRQKQQEEENINNYLYLAQNPQQQQIEVLRKEYTRLEGLNDDQFIEGSLANQIENSTHYQEEFTTTEPIEQQQQNQNMEDTSFNEENALNLAMNYNSRQSQYRKSQQCSAEKKTRENIKQIIKRQLHDMKEFLEQRTTDTTDDQNMSINRNNKSSSDEAILTSGDYKYKYETNQNDNINGNYIPSMFPYPKQQNKQHKNNSQLARDLSTSHDTTKLIDDESGNKQQQQQQLQGSSEKNSRTLSRIKQHDQYQEYLSETQIQPIKNQFNNTHPITHYKYLELVSNAATGLGLAGLGLGGSDHKQQSSQQQQHQQQQQFSQQEQRILLSQQEQRRRRNIQQSSSSQASNSKHTKKNLSIISDKFDDILEQKVFDLQLCPKQREVNEQNKSLYQRNPKRNNNIRSKSENKNNKVYYEEYNRIKVIKK